MTESERSRNKRLRRTNRRQKKKEEKYAKFDNFETVFTFNNLLESTLKCLKGVSWKASVQKVAIATHYETSVIYHAVLNGKFKVEEISEFYICERGKRRHIRSVGIRERIVQRCLCDNSLLPLIVPSLIYDNGASLKDKGVQFTRERLHRNLESFKRKNKDGYVLVFDFKKYFESIPHDLILHHLNKHYTNQRIIDLVMMFVRCSNPNGKGIDLGSQVSQILALVAASPLDHYIKEQLRCKYYARYMDDGYILCRTKEEAEFYKVMIENFVTNKLHMKLSEKKTKVVKLSKGFKFLKNRYRVINDKIIITPDKSTIIVMRRKLKKFVRKIEKGEMTYEDAYTSYQSWRSHLKGSKCYWTVQKMDKLFDSLFFDAFDYDYDRWEMYNYLDNYRMDKAEDKEMMEKEKELHNSLVQFRKETERKQRWENITKPKLLNDILEEERIKHKNDAEERNRIWYERHKSDTALIESLAWLDELQDTG